MLWLAVLKKHPRVCWVLESEWGPPNPKERKKRLHFIEDYYYLYYYSYYLLIREQKRREEKRRGAKKKKGFWVKGAESDWESASSGLCLCLRLRLGSLSLLVLGQIERPLSNARISHSLVSLFFWFFVHYLRFKILIFSPISLFQSSFFNFILVLDLFTGGGGINLFLAWTIFLYQNISFVHIFAVSLRFLCFLSVQAKEDAFASDSDIYIYYTK